MQWQCGKSAPLREGHISRRLVWGIVIFWKRLDYSFTTSQLMWLYDKRGNFNSSS